MAASPAKDELGELLQILEDDDLPALNNLPPPATIDITPQTRFASEHPYKLCVGTHNTAKIWIMLGARSTPRPSLAPTIKIYSGGSSDKSLAFFQFDQLDRVDMVQPFKRLWRKTRYDGTGSEKTWADNRRGMLKGMVYLYFLSKAIERGGTLRMPDPIKRYIGMALRRLGASPYPGQRNVVQDKAEATLLKADAECLGLQDKGLMNIENLESAEQSDTRTTLQRKKADLKRRLMELDAEEVEMERKNMAAKQPRTEKSKGKRPIVDAAGWKSLRLLHQNQSQLHSRQNGDQGREIDPSAQTSKSDNSGRLKINGQPSSKHKRRRIDEAEKDTANAGLLPEARKHPVSASGSSAATSNILHTSQPRQNAITTKRPSPFCKGSSSGSSSNNALDMGVERHVNADVNVDDNGESEYRLSNEDAPDDAGSLFVQDASSDDSYGSHLGTIDVARLGTSQVASQSTGPVSLAQGPSVSNSHFTKPVESQGSTASDGNQSFVFELPEDEEFDRLKKIYEVEVAKKREMEALKCRHAKEMEILKRKQAKEMEALKREQKEQRMSTRQELLRMYGISGSGSE